MRPTPCLLFNRKRILFISMRKGFFFSKLNKRHERKDDAEKFRCDNHPA